MSTSIETRLVDQENLRAAKAQSLFRKIHERILVRRVTPVQEEAGFICECPDSGCIDVIMMTAAQFRKVRAEPAYLVVEPGHVTGDTERVVSAGPNYAIVTKLDVRAGGLSRGPRGRG